MLCQVEDVIMIISVKELLKYLHILHSKSAICPDCRRYVAHFPVAERPIFSVSVIYLFQFSYRKSLAN